MADPDEVEDIPALDWDSFLPDLSVRHQSSNHIPSAVSIDIGDSAESSSAPCLSRKDSAESLSSSKSSPESFTTCDSRSFEDRSENNDYETSPELRIDINISKLLKGKLGLCKISPEIMCEIKPGKAKYEEAIGKINIYSPKKGNISAQMSVKMDKLTYCDTWLQSQKLSQCNQLQSTPKSRILCQQCLRSKRDSMESIDAFLSCVPSETQEWEFQSVIDSDAPLPVISRSAEQLAAKTDAHNASYQYLISSVSEPNLASPEQCTGCKNSLELSPVCNDRRLKSFARTLVYNVVNKALDLNRSENQQFMYKLLMKKIKIEGNECKANPLIYESSIKTKGMEGQAVDIPESLEFEAKFEPKEPDSFESQGKSLDAIYESQNSPHLVKPNVVKPDMYTSGISLPDELSKEEVFSAGDDFAKTKSETTSLQSGKSLFQPMKDYIRYLKGGSVKNEQMFEAEGEHAATAVPQKMDDKPDADIYEGTTVHNLAKKSHPPTKIPSPDPKRRCSAKAKTVRNSDHLTPTKIPVHQSRRRQGIKESAIADEANSASLTEGFDVKPATKEAFKEDVSSSEQSCTQSVGKDNSSLQENQQPESSIEKHLKFDLTKLDGPDVPPVESSSPNVTQESVQSTAEESLGIDLSFVFNSGIQQQNQQQQHCVNAQLIEDNCSDISESDASIIIDQMPSRRPTSQLPNSSNWLPIPERPQSASGYYASEQIEGFELHGIQRSAEVENLHSISAPSSPRRPRSDPPQFNGALNHMKDKGSYKVIPSTREAMYQQQEAGQTASAPCSPRMRVSYTSIPDSDRGSVISMPAGVSNQQRKITTDHEARIQALQSEPHSHIPRFQVDSLPNDVIHSRDRSMPLSRPASSGGTPTKIPYLSVTQAMSRREPNPEKIAAHQMKRPTVAAQGTASPRTSTSPSPRSSQGSPRGPPSLLTRSSPRNTHMHCIQAVARVSDYSPRQSLQAAFNAKGKITKRPMSHSNQNSPRSNPGSPRLVPSPRPETERMRQSVTLVQKRGCSPSMSAKTKTAHVMKKSSEDKKSPRPGVIDKIAGLFDL